MKEWDENSANSPTKKSVHCDNVTEELEDEQHDLVDFLSSGDHLIELDIQSGKKEAALQKSIDQGYVVIRFLDTRGTTELGMRLERDLCILGNGSIDKLTGRIQMAGTLVLNDVRVRATADINLEDLTGTGHLDPI